MSHHAACLLLVVCCLQLAVKHYITIIESMTEKELDSTNVKIFQEPSRITRLAIGSGDAPLRLAMLWTL
jgi:signal recognition particle subunit SRP54